MATSSMVPYSNPAGRNQTSPSTRITATPLTTVPTSSPVNPTAVAQDNPAVPSGVVTAPGGTSATVSTTPGGDQSAFYQQLQDIYGASGNQLFDFMQKIGGVDSQTLQDYIKSLQPQFAKSEANLRASLGAGGVSANSSVAALGEADLQSQEQGLISGESANLLQSQEQLQAMLLGGVLPSAEKQVADSSGWNTFAQILNAVGGVAGSFMGLGDVAGGIGGLGSLFKGFGGGGGGATVPTSEPAVPGGGLGTLQF